MSSYASLYDIKKYLSFDTSFTDEDDRIDFFLKTTTDEINGIIGDLLVSEKIENINLESVIGGRDIFLRNSYVNEITEINGQAYTGSKGTDYFLTRPQNRKLRILDLQNYLTNTVYNSWLFEIKYTSGFTPTTYNLDGSVDTEGDVPHDLIFAQCLMVAYSLNKDEGRDIVKYVMGPRTVQYSSSEEMLKKARDVLARYKQINLLK